MERVAIKQDKGKIEITEVWWCEFNSQNSQYPLSTRKFITCFYYSVFIMYLKKGWNEYQIV